MHTTLKQISDEITNLIGDDLARLDAGWLPEDTYDCIMLRSMLQIALHRIDDAKCGLAFMSIKCRIEGYVSSLSRKIEAPRPKAKRQLVGV